MDACTAALAHPALLTSDESVAAVKNILQLCASLEEVRGMQAEDAAKKQQEQAAA